MNDEAPNATPATQTPLLGLQHSQRTKPPKYHWYASRYLCLITVLAILCLCLRHAVNRSQAYLYQRRRQRLPPGKDHHPRPCSVQTIVEQVVQKWAFLTPLPWWLYGPDSLVDALFTTTYCAALIYFSLNHSKCECVTLVSADCSTGVGGTQNGANQMGVMVGAPRSVQRSLWNRLSAKCPWFSSLCRGITSLRFSPGSPIDV